MYRFRFAALASLALAAGLLSGCCLPHPLLGCHAGCSGTDCCDIGAVPDGEVPLGGGGGCCQAPAIAGNPPLLPPPNLAPPTGMPPLANPQPGDRLVPIPNNAAPRMPYNPPQ